MDRPTQIPQGAIVAVLTGDLVGSTRLGPTATDRALDRLRQVSRSASAWIGTETRFTRSRGDGWQMLLTDPGRAYRALVALSAGLRAAGKGPLSRIVMGLGTVSALPDGDLSGAAGEAFEVSGRALDTLPKARLFAIDGPGTTALHRGMLGLTEDRVRHWTAEQAEATLHYIDPSTPTLSEIAERLGISTQAVSYRVRGAGAQNLRDAALAWEDDAEQRWT